MNSSKVSPYIFNPASGTNPPPLGGKARALFALGQNGNFRIPTWFAILPEAALKNRRIAQRAIPEIQAVLATFPKKIRFAVRSSALDEDGAEHSFAGQLDSFLNVSPRQLIDRIERVWSSGYSPRLLAYRRERGLPPPAHPPVVIVQQMLEPEVSGVAFAADPTTGRRSVVVISGLWGLGTALVGGDADADTWQVNRQNQIIERRIVAKPFADQRHSGKEGVSSTPVPITNVHSACLTDEQILAVTALVRSASQAFDSPQDIEWAFQDNTLFLLQSRPITSLANLPDPDGALLLWDNSNIAESYNGISSPLTFSFARRVYEEVYRQFCRILSVPESRIEENTDTFRRMLGYVRGRIYYNLVSWYRVLALLPGFQINRHFMEQMMGVKEGLSPEILATLTPSTTSRWRDGWHLFGSLRSLIASHFRLDRDIARFYVRLNTALATPHPPLADQRLDELAAHYRSLEAQLLTRWDAPLVNDFFAMIFHGVLRKFSANWCLDEALCNELTASQGSIISAEPATRLRSLAALAASDAGFIRLLAQGSLAEINAALPSHPEFATEYHSYLAKFAGRCLEELKLETETLDDDPLFLLRSIARLASQPAVPSEPREHPSVAAEASVARALHGQSFHRVIFHWVLRHTRARIQARENLRFERTRVFGRVRQIFQEIGRRLHSSQHLEAPRDIFFLGVEEILGFIDGTTLTTDLRPLVALRQAEQEKYRVQSAPADRFETRGAVHDGHTFAAAQPPLAPEGDSLQGLGCSPGLVRGRARVILDPRNALIEPGEILVAPRTDPGWILLFPSAAGLLVEYGSLLSHSAIVSREIGLPAIVSLPGLTQWIQTGDWLEMDGSTGVARKISPP